MNRERTSLEPSLLKSKGMGLLSELAELTGGYSDSSEALGAEEAIVSV